MLATHLQLACTLFAARYQLNICRLFAVHLCRKLAASLLQAYRKLAASLPQAFAAPFYFYMGQSLFPQIEGNVLSNLYQLVICLLYTSDAADE